jgi:hypothetical protein
VAGWLLGTRGAAAHRTPQTAVVHTAACCAALMIEVFILKISEHH